MWGKMERKEKVKGILYFVMIQASGLLNSWFNVNVDNEVSIFFPRYYEARGVLFPSSSPS